MVVLIACFDLLTRTVVGGLLCLGGVAKIAMTDDDRRKWLASYRLLPRGLVPSIAALFPVIELAIGTALLLGVFGPLPSLSASGLILAISIATAIALARGDRPECGCFGRISHQLISTRIVVRNVALVVLGVGDIMLVPARIGAGSIGPLGSALLAASIVALLFIAGTRVADTRARLGWGQ